MKVNYIYDLIGKTPVVKLNTLTEGLTAEIYVKLEWFNPGGSVKDRIAKSMIEAAEKEGYLKKGQTIIEPTSGNTGIGLALVAAAKGYPLIITMPDTLSIERRKILEGYGAKLILTDGKKGMKEAINIASSLAKEHNYFMPMQFDNLNNPKAHMTTTAQEIIEDFNDLDYLVVGVGTGGTITGTGNILKSHYNNLKIIAVEPKNSAVLSGKEAGPHKIQGIGAGFIPNILDQSVYKDVITVTDDEAFETARLLAKKEGLFVGISSGANVCAALKIAKTIKEPLKILTFSPSNAERYLSTDLFNQSKKV
ncbi:MAG: cysteine synthase A [Candidatus Izemoplasmataceae bacterium]